METQLQLRGQPILFGGDIATVSTRNGYVFAHLMSPKTQHFLPGSSRAILTPDQADELARDLKAYAEQARRES